MTETTKTYPNGTTVTTRVYEPGEQIKEEGDERLTKLWDVAFGKTNQQEETKK